MAFRLPSRTAGVLCLGLGLAAVACEERSAPAGAMQTTEVQPQMESVKASGCLLAGMAENTYVLNTSGNEGGNKPTTYQLTGHDVALRDYVGQQVDVSGTVETAQRIAGTDAPVVDEPKGTSGTPTIETKTEIDVKQMTVSSVTPSGERCAPELPSTEQPDRRIK